MNTSYLITWIEGDEVCYRIVGEEEIERYWEIEKNYIVTRLTA